MTLTELKQAVFVNDEIPIHIVDLQIALHDLAAALQYLHGEIDAGIVSPNEAINKIERMLKMQVGR